MMVIITIQWHGIFDVETFVKIHLNKASKRDVCFPLALLSVRVARSMFHEYL